MCCTVLIDSGKSFQSIPCCTDAFRVLVNLCSKTFHIRDLIVFMRYCNVGDCLTVDILNCLPDGFYSFVSSIKPLYRFRTMFFYLPNEAAR